MYDYSDLEKIWSSLSEEHNEKKVKVGSAEHQAPHHEPEDPIKHHYFSNISKSSEDSSPVNNNNAEKEFHFLRKELEKTKKENLELTQKLEEKKQELESVNQYLCQIEKFIEKFD